MIITMIERPSAVHIMRSGKNGINIFEVEMIVTDEEHLLLQEVVKQAIQLSIEQHGKFEENASNVPYTDVYASSELRIQKRLNDILEKIYIPEPQT